MVAYYSNKKRELSGQVEQKLKEIGRMEQCEKQMKWEVERECKKLLKAEERECELREIKNHLEEAARERRLREKKARAEKTSEQDRRVFKLSLMTKSNHKLKAECNKSYEHYVRQYASKYDADEEKAFELSQIEQELKYYEKQRNEKEGNMHKLLEYQPSSSTLVRS